MANPGNPVLWVPENLVFSPARRKTGGDLELLSGVGTCGRLLEACDRSERLGEGGDEDVAQPIVLKNGTDSADPSLLEKLFCQYVSCGKVELARLVFDKMQRPRVFLWNSMIRAYSWNGPFHRAVDLFRRMVNSGVAPNKFTFPFVLKACSGLLVLQCGKEIHSRVMRVGLHADVFVCTALVDMYMKCGRLDESRRLFVKMSHRDIVAWNAMVAGCALHGMHGDAIDFVLDMTRTGVTPNSSTVVAVLPAIGEAKALTHGKSVHAFCVRKGLEKVDVLVGTALLDVYGKCNHIDYAQKIFDAMTVRNEVTWSAIIGAYVSCDHMAKALEAFNQMMLEGHQQPTSPTLASILRACARLTELNGGRQMHGYLLKSGFSSDIMVGNSLLSMYSKCGNAEDAVGLFSKMETRDTVSYGAIISGCLQNGNVQEALHIFRKMQASRTEPDVATMVGVIPACSHLAAVQHGRCSHGHVIVRGLSSDISICNALIDMYAKCGRINDARDIFDRMVKRDVVSWNAIISGYGIHGLGKEALSLFHSLQITGLNPDDVTFICLLSACSHSGLIKEGKELFSAMTKSFNIVPRIEHCICMVDLLGRGGHLDEAQDFIKNMPFASDVCVWGALLSACRLHKNLQLGEEVSRIIQKLGPEGTGNFVLLSNIYSAAGKFDEAAIVRIHQKRKGFKKSPGCSWIEIRGKVHAFIGGDQSHPDSLRIHEILGDLFVEMQKLGYKANTSYVLQNVEEEEKEHLLLYHSEKLAIAFGILSLSGSQPIFVTKNLRVCGDCHNAIKFITTITKREISLRDANRFHHFIDGNCSCGDFW
ncbi:hypothetical protein Taro_033569 [Colocasia esculenta]|uniref:DYW domain-containing protein n=1 Tax=Colocasia esculenta TaxID=4460 RepID=A0A843WCW5_COLES|nr:hypothetical protein [Colocasia esculenta]